MTNEERSKKNCLKRTGRALRQKPLLFTLLVLTVITLVISPIIIFSSKLKENQSVCSTSSCYEISKKLLQDMDTNVNPCDNFYNFVCGKFMNNTKLSAQADVKPTTRMRDKVIESIRGLLQKPVERTDPNYFILAKSLYHACMNTQEIEKKSLPDLTKKLKSFGGWPVVEGVNWNENNFSWIKTIYNLTIHGFSNDMLFQLDFFRFESPSTILMLQPPGTMKLQMYLRKGFSHSTVQSYYDYMIKVAVAFGADKERARAEMKEVIDFEITLSKVEKRRGFDLTKTFFSLERYYPYVPWLEYINLILKPLSKVMKYSDQIAILSPNYFGELGILINNTSPRTIVNFIYWRTIANIMVYLNEDLRNMELEFLKIYIGSSGREARWNECSRKVINMVTVAAGAMYVRELFHKENEVAVLKMSNEIRDQFFGALETTSWMDNVTRKHAQEKLKAIKAFVVPNELKDDDKMNNFYQNLTVNSLQYLDSILNVSLFNSKVKYAEIDQPKTYYNWRDYADPTFINAAYNFKTNNLWFSPAILQDVYFDYRRPEYMNYGGIGPVIGHELCHGFDPSGRYYNKDGYSENWWQPEAEAAFKKKIQCIINQYSNIFIPELNMTIDGRLSIDENIADNSGIKYAYLAFKKWLRNHGPGQNLPGLPYTPEQLFWISAGSIRCEKRSTDTLEHMIKEDEHLPYMYRLNVPLMNSGYFAKDFNCPVGSPMNPVDKCVVW